MARRANKNNDYQSWRKYTQEAGALYLQAAERYMEDDENYLCELLPSSEVLYSDRNLMISH